MPNTERKEIISGHIEVGRTQNTYEVVINMGPLETDEQGRSFMVFSPKQARNLAKLLVEHADKADEEWQAL